MDVFYSRSHIIMQMFKGISPPWSHIRSASMMRYNFFAAIAIYVGTIGMCIVQRWFNIIPWSWIWIAGLVGLGMGFGVKRGLSARELMTGNGNEPFLTDDSVVVITGGNCGLGEATALQLNFGGQLILACRRTEQAELVAKRIHAMPRKTEKYTHPTVTVMKLDLSDFKSVRSFAAEFHERFKRCDVLINNAGVMHPSKFVPTKQGLELQFGVNHVGHFLLTKLLYPALEAARASRVINVASFGHVWAPEVMSYDMLCTEKGKADYDKFRSYGISKMSNILFTQEMQRRLASKHHGRSPIRCMSLHPGMVRTELMRHIFGNPIMNVLYSFVAFPLTFVLMKSASEGAQTQLFLAQASSKQITKGAYYVDCRPTRPNHVNVEHGHVQGRRLWEYTERVIGEKFNV